MRSRPRCTASSTTPSPDSMPRDDVGCMILTGADPAFCAGFDLKSLSTELRSVQQQRQRNPVKHLGMMPPHETPVIGAINGAAVTGGLELAMCCDFLIASDRARFADTHARVGVMPGGGMTIRLPQLIGIDRARRMSLTGDFIDAHTARDWGLVVEVVPHESLLDRAREIARHHRLHPGRERARGPTRYAEIGALSGPEAWAAETRGRATGWRSDSTRAAWPPSAPPSSPAAGSRPRDSTARRHEGLRRHGPAAHSGRGDRPCPTGGAAWATTGCTWPRRSMTRWPSRCWSLSTRSGSWFAPAWPWPSPAAPP